MKFDKRLGPVKVFTDQNTLAHARVLDDSRARAKAKVICGWCHRSVTEARSGIGLAFGPEATALLDSTGSCIPEHYIRQNAGILPLEVIRLLRETLRDPRTFPVHVDSSGALLITTSPILEMIQRIETARRELRAKGCTRY
jgi:hypothetical protein